MAEDFLQKSVQGISDPTARKKAYYSRQRENAEENQDYGTLDKIKGKQGKGPAERMPKNATQDQWENAFNTAVGFTPLGRAARVAEGAGEAASVARSLIPRAEEAAEGEGGMLARRSQNLGKAKPVKPRLEAKKGLPTERKAIKGETPKKTLKGESSPQKALPKPKARAVSKVEKGTGNTKMGKKLPKGKVSPKANKGHVTDRGDSAHMSNKYYKRMKDSTEKLNKMDEAKPKKKKFF